MTERSIRDTTTFVREIQNDRKGGNFVFLNLMETHLPYSPPDEFVQKFVPYFYETPEAQQFMREFNRKAMQWLIPLIEPFSELEAATLSDMYDAEVAFQDHLLAQLIEVLDSSYHRENSMVIFMADHGEMLGEHGFMGHGFGVYEELIRAPLFMRVPGLDSPGKVQNPISTTQVFHTVLDYFGFESLSMPYAEEVDVRSQSLLRMLEKRDATPVHVVSEAYAPENAVDIMHKHTPELLERHHADRARRAVYQGDEKMIQVEGISKLLYDLAGDPTEGHPYQNASRIDALTKALDTYLELSASRRNSSTSRKIVLDDEIIQKRLRDLGYLE